MARAAQFEHGVGSPGGDVQRRAAPEWLRPGNDRPAQRQVRRPVRQAPKGGPGDGQGPLGGGRDRARSRTGYRR